MKRTKTVKSIGLAILAVLVLALTAGAGSGKNVIKIATLAPEGSSWIEAFDGINAELKKKTSGAVRFKIYAGGVLGDEKDMIRKMYVGQIQGAVLTSAGLSNIFSEMDVFQIPFLFESYDEVDYVEKNMAGLFKKGFEKKGFTLLAWSEGGFIRLMSTVPIASVDDLRKAKVWTWEDAPMAKAIFDEAGISAIPLSLPDVLVGLQTGLVDVVYAPPSGAISLQWFTKTKYMTDLPLIYLIGALVVTQKSFNRLSPENRKVLVEVCSKHMAHLKEIIRQENQEAIQVMIRHGVKLIKPSNDQIEQLEEISQKAMTRQMGKSFSPKVKNQVTDLLEAFRKSKK
jgi:TRAP-type C4-dicarboxylate transport system substrate-binding protein